MAPPGPQLAFSLSSMPPQLEWSRAGGGTHLLSGAVLCGHAQRSVTAGELCVSVFLIYAFEDNPKQINSDKLKIPNVGTESCNSRPHLGDVLESKNRQVQAKHPTARASPLEGKVVLGLDST